jgi:hypothetical protein
MKVEHLYEIALDLQADLKETNIISIMNELLIALQNQIDAPNPTYQEQISNHKEKLSEALKLSRINNYPPSWNIPLEAMDIKEYVGCTLDQKISNILSKNQITVNDAHKEILQQKDIVETISTSIDNLILSLKYLEFTPDVLNAGEYEISIMIPRAAVHNEVGRLGKELELLNKIFGVFSEIATGSREPFKLRSISTTDPTVFIESLPAVALLVAAAIERCVVVYNGVLDIVIKHKEMSGMNIPDKVLNLLKEHITTEIDKGLKEIVNQIESENFQNIPAGRKNELRTELSKAIKDIATRLDNGYCFDVRGEPPIPDNNPVDENDVQVENKSEKTYWLVSEARKNIRFFKSQGEPILGLPKPINDSVDESIETKKK